MPQEGEYLTPVHLTVTSEIIPEMETSKINVLYISHVNVLINPQFVNVAGKFTI